MSERPNITTWKELVDYADGAINYPLEAFLEKRIPVFDTLTDAVCAAVVIAEDIGNTSVETKNKLARKMLHAHLKSAGWNSFVVQMIDFALIFAIEGVVLLLDGLFPSGWNKLIDMLFDADVSIFDIFPATEDSA